MTEFTDQEKDTIRGGVMGAVALVSQASPGFFDVFKESNAAATALKAAPAQIQELMRGGLVMPPHASSKEEMHSKILDQLGQAMQVTSKDPATQDALRNYVLAAVQEVANASKGVSPEEAATIERIQQALSSPAGQAPAQQPQGQPNPAEQPVQPAQPGTAPVPPAQQPEGTPDFQPPIAPGQQQPGAPVFPPTNFSTSARVHEPAQESDPS